MNMTATERMGMMGMGMMNPAMMSMPMGMGQMGGMMPQIRAAR